jgi:molybdopterin synthase catalytic subunit
VTRLFELREAPLSLDECFAAVQRPEAGGVAIFIGTVRNQNQGQDVARLDIRRIRAWRRKSSARSRASRSGRGARREHGARSDCASNVHDVPVWAF